MPRRSASRPIFTKSSTCLRAASIEAATLSNTMTAAPNAIKLLSSVLSEGICATTVEMAVVVPVRPARTAAFALCDPAAEAVKARTTPSSVAFSAVAAAAVRDAMLRTSLLMTLAARWTFCCRRPTCCRPRSSWPRAPDNATPADAYSGDRRGEARHRALRARRVRGEYV